MKPHRAHWQESDRLARYVDELLADLNVQRRLVMPQSADDPNKHRMIITGQDADVYLAWVRLDSNPLTRGRYINNRASATPPPTPQPPGS